MVGIRSCGGSVKCQKCLILYRPTVTSRETTTDQNIVKQLSTEHYPKIKSAKPFENDDYKPLQYKYCILQFIFSSLQKAPQ